mmetsp:Transcript_7823/g.25795  ORF Transcript_7823/g.25795 Transcript_7823/m.25795 type:complete len:469 (+) Transcript_7823:264-1670(+)
MRAVRTAGRRRSPRARGCDVRRPQPSRRMRARTAGRCAASRVRGLGRAAGCHPGDCSRGRDRQGAAARRRGDRSRGVRLEPAALASSAVVPCGRGDGGGERRRRRLRGGPLRPAVGRRADAERRRRHLADDRICVLRAGPRGPSHGPSPHRHERELCQPRRDREGAGRDVGPARRALHRRQALLPALVLGGRSAQGGGRVAAAARRELPRPLHAPLGRPLCVCAARGMARDGGDAAGGAHPAHRRLQLWDGRAPRAQGLLPRRAARHAAVKVLPLPPRPHRQRRRRGLPRGDCGARRRPHRLLPAQRLAEQAQGSGGCARPRDRRAGRQDAGAGHPPLGRPARPERAHALARRGAAAAGGTDLRFRAQRRRDGARVGPRLVQPLAHQPRALFGRRRVRRRGARRRGVQARAPRWHGAVRGAAHQGVRHGVGHAWRQQPQVGALISHRRHYVAAMRSPRHARPRLRSAV